jgi:phosphoribosylaminoimidazole-succinocarboxamide synthase
MAKMPPALPDDTLSGIDRVHRGKVRDSYDLPGHSDKRLVVVTDRLSVHDVILPCLVKDKGAILNFIDIWWRQQFAEEFPHLKTDLVAWGPGIDEYLPEHLRGNLVLYKCARIIQKADMIPVEFIARGRLFGSALKAYEKGQLICGQTLPKGLKSLDLLNPVLFTPTNKSQDGHDEAITIEECDGICGDEHGRYLTIALFEYARKVARSKNLDLLDTKFEFGRLLLAILMGYVLCDEACTPDSSRYVDPEELERAIAECRDPKSMDKQPVRDWGTTVLGLTAKSPLTPELIGRVHSHEVDSEIIDETRSRYTDLLNRLAGVRPDEFIDRYYGKTSKN